MKRLMSAAVAIFLALSILTFQSCGKKKEDAIKIGAILPLTGAASTPGNSAKNGILLGAERFGLEVVIEDSKSNPRDGLNGFMKISSENSNLTAVISLMSSVSKSIIPITEKSKILSFHVASFPNLVKGKKYAFRWYITSKDQMKALIDYVIQMNMRSRRIAFIYTNDDYGIGAFQAFKTILTEKSLTMDISSLAYDTNKKNFRNELNKIKEKNPQVIVIVGYSSNLGILVRQIRELRTKALILADDAVSYPDVLQSAGSAANGIIFPGLQLQDLIEESEFAKLYSDKFGQHPDDFATFSLAY